MISVLLVSMAVSMALTWFFGFFVGLAVTFAIFILFSMYMRRRSLGYPTGILSGVNYICIACGHRFKGGECPRCGSRMRRAEF